MKILINNEILKFSKDDFPMLINGTNKSGASFFSISLLANFFEAGEKVILFSAYPPAKEEFRKQLGNSINENAKIIDSGEEELFIDKLGQIQNLEERIILIKNVEKYSQNLFFKLKKQKFIIFSGDIDKCEFVDYLDKKDFKTKIFFSYSKKIKVTNKIELPKYNGLIINNRHNGLVTLAP